MQHILDNVLHLLLETAKQKKGAPEMATPSLDFCRGEGREANSLRSDSLPSLYYPQQKYKAPSRAQRQKKKANPSRGWPLSFWLASRWFGFLPLTFPA
ncbi:MAG: hypothetical protein ACRYGN_22700, partial [Janthinobacterium lividum]